MGSSLVAIRDKFSEFGYVLVCCNLVGVNAFFVHKDYQDKFRLYGLDDLFAPPRYYLFDMWKLNYGHRRTLKNQAARARFLFPGGS